MKKFLLFTCLVIMVLGFTLSTLAEKEQKKYFEKEHCGTGHECRVDDCGIKQKGYCVKDKCQKNWGQEKNCGSCWGYKKKKVPRYHYKPACRGKYNIKHYGDCHRDFCHDNCRRDDCHKGKWFDDRCFKKDYCRPIKKCDNGFKECGTGYRNYKEFAIGCAAPQ